MVFHAAEVDQVRNDHNLLKDFEDEIPGYLNTQRIVSTLEDLALRAGENEIYNNLLTCYEALVRIEVIPAKELELVEAWLTDLATCQPDKAMRAVNAATVSLEATAT